MEAIGRLARGVAHDFNNVLAAIIGSGDLLQMHLRDGDPAREEAREIQKAAERGASLTRRLLTFARSQMREPEIVDLDAAVLPLAGTLQRVAGDRVPVRVRTRGRRTPIRIEPGQLEQVMLNLVVDARDAMMPRGGPVDVTIDALTVDKTSAAYYNGVAAGDYARVSVHDSGVGIEPEMQAHIFEPFFSTKDPSKGTGLGLSIVYSIAKEAGGSVTFTSRPNEGTTFEVLLPLIPGP